MSIKVEECKIWKMPLPDLSVLTQECRPKTNDKYNRIIKDRTGKELGVVDVYCVIDAFNIKAPSMHHAVKKILCAGTRGKGDEVQDLEEAIQAIQRRLMEVKK